MMEGNSAIVIDNGSGTTKAGFAGDDAPRAVLSTIIGKPKVPAIMVGLDMKETYVGEEAQLKRGVLRLEHPVQRGVIKNWEGIEKLWHHVFYNEL